MSPRRAHRPQLTQKEIVAAALRLIDRDGLAGQSMRALGAELDVDPSTVYYHVPGKAALYDLVVDEILSAIDVSHDDPSAAFTDRVVTASKEYRRALLRHPRAVPLVAVRSLRTPTQLSVVETLSRIFFDAGFTPAEALIAIDTCGLTILGMTSMHAAALTESEYHVRRAGSAAADRTDLPQDRYPNVTRMLAAAASLDAELEFDRALRALAEGMLALHAAGALAPDHETTGDGPAVVAHGGE